jgi:hypothetical protein
MCHHVVVYLSTEVSDKESLEIKGRRIEFYTLKMKEACSLAAQVLTVVVSAVTVSSETRVRSNYILITNLMYQLLFIHKMLCPSTCFEP